MADPEFITELDLVTSFDDTDLAVVEHDPSGTPETVRITIANWVANYLKRRVYQISRTVASNNLTVALKNSDGNNPSSAQPLSLDIAGNVRKVSGALSLTVNAGVSTFNMGSAELANTDQELFVYAGWRASDSSVFLIIARFPYAHFYADFSATATNEKYGAYSGSAPAATDPVQVIGRFTIRNSGTASYNWSIPADTLVVSRPIYETRWLDWNALPQGFSLVPSSPVYRYKLVGRALILNYNEPNNGTSNNTIFTATAPWTPTYNVSTPLGLTVDNNTIQTAPGRMTITAGSNTIVFRKDTAIGAWTNALGKRAAGTAIAEY